MSEHLAIPATTFVLNSIIEQRLKKVYQGLPAPKVSNSPPPRPAQSTGNGQPQQPAEAPGLTLFMHHAGPNPAWRNLQEPVVDFTGARVKKNPLVLDLQYLLAAHGSSLEREAVLGVAMSAFHRNAIIPRPMITAILGAIAAPNPPENLLDLLPSSKLADKDYQPESITISQLPVDLDMSTKLWSAFQSPIRPSAMYQVTTVFLEVDEEFDEAPRVETVRISGRPEPEGSDSAFEPDIILSEDQE